MLRVTTLYASSASASAAYYANYLVDAPGEIPGVWSGRQAAALGLSGDVAQDALEALLRGRDPRLGHRSVTGSSTGSGPMGRSCGQLQGSTPRSRARSR